MKHLVYLVLCLSHFALAKEEGFNWRPIQNLAIQDRGRMKPMDTFARESVLFVTGKASWEGKNPTEVIFGWLFAFEKDWENKEFIRVDYQPLKEKMNLAADKKYFSPGELQSNEGIRPIMAEALKKQQIKERLDTLEQKAMQVSNQLGLVQAIVRGNIINILPAPKAMSENWVPVSAITDPQGGGIPYGAESSQKLTSLLSDLVKAYIEGNVSQWNTTAPEFARFVRNELGSGVYPSESSLNLEIQYNHLRPFRWAWILYLVAFATLLTFIVTQKKAFAITGAVFLIAGFGVHTYGMLARCFIAGRPPVTNMYESVIWVCLGCVFFSGIIWAKYKKAAIPTAALAFAIAGLILGDNLPTVLDPSINPLEPVLRSNFWLTIHVLTITLSYAAFALSLCLGNVVIGNYVFTPTQTERIQQYALYAYRSVQIGVVLLAAGTILGGVWADYSWGRFWGWDPKEVWALIALLLYLAVLHGRFSGWLKGFGFIAATVLSFLGILMAWYGVNFVLGVGLHSYGFGTGGMSYVLMYVAAQLAFIGLGYFRYQETLKGGGKGVNASIFPKGGR